MRPVLSLVAALLLAPPAPQAPRIKNLVPAFLAYEEACRDAPPEVKAKKWDEMLEAKWPEFFRDAIYRGLKGEDREKYEASCREEFFRDVAPRIGEIAALNDGVEKRISAAVDDFRRAFPAFAPAGDFYVTVSFSFRGKVVTVAGKDVLAIGLEKFPGDDGSQVLITLAHEMFHLCHLPGFSAGGGLYRSLWTEGLASYASAVVVPGRRMSGYLGFTGEKMNRCAELLAKMAAELRANLGENDRRLKRAYFGAEENDLGIPPEAGYYVGFLIVQSLAAGTPVAELAKLTPEQVFPMLGDALKAMEETGK